MLNFIPLNRHCPAVLLMRTWVFLGVVAPLGMTCFCPLLLIVLAALVGAPIVAVNTGFLVDVQEPLAQVSFQLWLTSSFIMVLLSGLSGQLIRRTLKNPLSAPLLEMVGRIRKAMDCAVLTPARATEFVPQHLGIFFHFSGNTPGLPLPVSLLPAVTSRLE